MPRPLVAVFQEYASLSFTPAAADLNTCIAAVCNQVVDYDPTLPAATKTTVTFDRTGFDISRPASVKVGAIVEDATITLIDPEEEIFFGTGSRAAGVTSNKLTLTTTTGMASGQPVFIGGVFVGNVTDVDGVKFEVPAPAASTAAERLTLAKAWVNQTVTVDGIDRVKVTAVVAGASSEYSTAATPVLTGLTDVLVSVADPNGIYANNDRYILPGDKVYVKKDAVSLATTVSAVNATSIELDADLTSFTASVAMDSVLITRAIKENDAKGNPIRAFTVASSFRNIDDAGDISVDGGAALTSGKVIGKAAAVHVGYVARRIDSGVVKFNDIKSTADIPAVLGKVDVRNPLALAAWVALQNTGTRIVTYAVTEDSTTGFSEFLKAVAPRKEVYCVVPVSMDPVTQLTVVKEMKAKFNTMADPENALAKGVAQRFKMVVASGFAIKDPKLVSQALVNSAEDTGGGWLLTAADGKFVTDGVLTGDRVTNGTISTLVTRRVSNQALLVEAEITGEIDVERDLDSAGEFAEWKAMSKGVNSKRVVMLLGDSVSVPAQSSSDVSAAYLACAVGGMIAGLPPHSGITNLSIAGVEDIRGTHTVFDEEQLSELSDAGWCVFIEDAPSGAPYCIHGVTTDPSAVEFREIMSVKNFDYVASVLGNQLNDFIGTWNLNAETLGFISSSLSGAINNLKAKRVAKLGAPVIDGTITSLAQHADQKDRAEVFVELKMPKTLNTIGLHLVSV